MPVPVGNPLPLPTPDPNNPVAWWLTLLVVGGVAVAAFFGAFRSLRRARLVEDVPTSRARSAALGYVELAGRAEPLPGEPVLAPLSGRPCVWYRYRVDQHQRDSVTGKSEWRTVEQGVSDVLFQLVDDTGACVVDPDHAEVTPAVRDRWRGTSPRPGGPPRRRGGWLWGGSYLYREELIRPGDPLHAVGNLRSVHPGTDDTPAADQVRDTLALWKRDPARMRAFDADGDGRVDLEEWQGARLAAGEEVARERARRASAPRTPVLAAAPASGRPYLLAAVDQAGLAARYRWAALARLALFVLASAAGALLLQALPPG